MRKWKWRADKKTQKEAAKEHIKLYELRINDLTSDKLKKYVSIRCSLHVSFGPATHIYMFHINAEMAPKTQKWSETKTRDEKKYEMICVLRIKKVYQLLAFPESRATQYYVELPSQQLNQLNKFPHLYSVTFCFFYALNSDAASSTCLDAPHRLPSNDDKLPFERPCFILRLPKSLLHLQIINTLNLQDFKTKKICFGAPSHL